ncbi:hypothetical protein, partial [Nocardia araoensis]|uniref:hypothetical protein n=1 Tax=Nocardia araoensis TaxID=228600 RepID=UPI001C3F3453
MFGRLVGLLERVVQTNQFRTGVEDAPSRALQLVDPLLPRALLIHPHRAPTKSVERIIQRIPRQILVIHRQTTTSIREISLRVRQLPLRRMTLRGKTFHIGTGGALYEVGEGGDIVGAPDDLGAQCGLHFGELRGGQSLVLVELAVAVDLVDLGPPFRARVG